MSEFIEDVCVWWFKIVCVGLLIGGAWGIAENMGVIPWGPIGAFLGVTMGTVAAALGFAVWLHRFD
jgi:hypothetical protein